MSQGSFPLEALCHRLPLERQRDKRVSQGPELSHGGQQGATWANAGLTRTFTVPGAASDSSSLEDEVLTCTGVTMADARVVGVPFLGEAFVCFSRAGLACGESADGGWRRPLDSQATCVLRCSSSWPRYQQNPYNSREGVDEGGSGSEAPSPLWSPPEPELGLGLGLELPMLFPPHCHSTPRCSLSLLCAFQS